jgi:CP family cyanate transporter-like MFS transporter
LTGYGLLSLVLALAWWLVVQNQTLAEGTSGGYRQVLRRPSSWWLAVGFTGPLIAYLGLSSWLGQLLTQERGMSPEAASSLVGFLSLVGLPIAPLGGWLTTRLGLRRPFVIGCGLVLPLAGLGLIWLPHPYVWASLMGIAFQLYVSAFFTIPMELPGVSSASVGLTMGFVLSFAYLVSFGAPTLVGWSRDWSGHFLIGLSVCVLCPATLALSGLCLPETGPGFLTPEPQDRALE